MDNFGTLVENLFEIAINMNTKFVDTDSKLKELEAKLSIMDTYRMVVDYIGVEQDVNKIIQIITDVVIGVLGVTYCTVSLFQGADNERELVEYKISPDIKNIVNESNIEILESKLKNENGILVIEDLKKNNFFCMEQGAFISIGLSRGPNFYGSMTIYYENMESLNKNKVEFFKLIGSQLELHIENAKLFAKLRIASITDELSGLYNRIYLNEILLKDSNNNYLYNIENLSIIIADIDNFKRVNDTYGHFFGDKVIKNLSKVLKEIQKNYHVDAFRFGGEEFLIVAKDKSIEEIEEIAEKIRSSFSNIKYNIQNQEEEAAFTISIGIAKYGYTTKIKDARKLIEDADLALYYSKNNGKNRYTIATGKIQLYMNSKLDLEKIIEKHRRTQIPYVFLKVNIIKESFTFEENIDILNILKNTFRKYDYLFSNSMGEFVAILEDAKVVDTVSVRLAETLEKSGYNNVEIKSEWYKSTDFNINNLF